MFRSFGESEEDRESEANVALRLGMRGLPVPATSSDFNARVHAALVRPTPWWQVLWAHARPLVSAAACSLLITLALLRGLATTTADPRSLARHAGAGAVVAYGIRDRIDALDSSDELLTAASLTGFGASRRSLAAKQSPPKARPRPIDSESHS